MNKKSILWLIMTVLLVLMAACGNEDTTSEAEAEEPEDPTTSETAEDAFPVTTTIEGEEVTVEEKPEQIAALSLNVADAVMDLRGPESVVAVTSSMESENLSHFSEETANVEHVVQGAISLDPETVISYDPDLILLTLTHGAEEDANQMLTEAGIPLGSFERWTTLQDVMNNYELIGQLVGEEEKATQIIADMQEKIDQAEQKVDEAKEKPTVLMLSQVGSTSGPYILGPSSMAYDVVQLAGGQPGSDVLGLDRSSPASIEHVIEMDPDYVILVEWSETSDEFSELVESEGFQTLTAVQEDRVKRLPAKDISQANRFVVDQLDELIDWFGTGKE